MSELYITTHEIIKDDPDPEKAVLDRVQALHDEAQTALDFGDPNEFYRLINEADLIEYNYFFG